MSAPLGRSLCASLHAHLQPSPTNVPAIGHWTTRYGASLWNCVTDRRPRRMNTMAARGGDGCGNCPGVRHHQRGSRPARSGGHLPQASISREEAHRRRGRKGGERSPFTAAPIVAGLA